MLGGVRDEVVPRTQMQELWEIVRSRGRTRDAEKPVSPAASTTGEKAKAKAAARRTSNVGDDDEDDNSKAPPRVVTDGGNTYIEFSAGTHSECLLVSFMGASVLSLV